MLRRRSQPSPPRNAEPELRPERADKAYGKGRPTPKRKEAERRHRQPISAPRDRKEAYRQFRERQRTQRQRTREGIARGDERYLPAREKGPVRKFARDWVDSRRTLSEFFVIFTLVILVLSMVPSFQVRLIVTYYVWPAMMLLIAVDLFRIARRVTGEAARRFPDENLRGVRFYAIMRALQIRRMRFPPPLVKPGAKI